MAQTLRRLGGRQPLCGIGVTSLMERICRPAAASAWMADSRPEPGPCTRTCTRLTPMPNASRAHDSAATVAVNGVDFLDPLNPAFPDDAHATALPCMSVMVTIVLLKVAFTWAMPSASTTRLLFLLVPVFAVAMPSDGRELPRPFAYVDPRASVRPRAGRDYLVTFFLPAIARRGPFFVRALVCVRCPRTGRPRRCRMPRYDPMSINRLMFIATSVRNAPSTR